MYSVERNRFFKRALPVWEAKKGEEKNDELLFRCHIECRSDVRLSVATSCEYQLWINASFVAFGPAKAAHGYYKVDTLALDAYLRDGSNTLVLKVVSANINSFAVLDQSPFVTAEIRCGADCLAWTGDDGCFLPFRLSGRIQKVQRYSYQRTFAEVYRLTRAESDFYCGKGDSEPVGSVCFTHKTYIPRDVRYPQYKRSKAEKLVGRGRVNFERGCDSPIRDRALLNIGESLKGFPVEELDERLSDELQEFGYISESKSGDLDGALKLTQGYATLEFPFNMTGFVTFKVSCAKACTVYVLFDEILSSGDVDFLRLTSCNALKYYVEPGAHSVVSFEPYTMKYIKLVVRGDACITDVALIQFKHPEVPYAITLPADKDLNAIYEAALETYKANAVDLFYDCPSRERAGWLCDSYFTARVEQVLTGESVLERAFLNNFLMPDAFPHLPRGVLPMCYPADHYNGEYIPNWMMWFVLQLEEYYARSKDLSLIRRARGRVYELVAYFEAYEGAEGLLEKLESWVFVEWSAANDWVQDINFPSNMLYVRMLRAVANLYGDETLLTKSERLKEVVRARSFDGDFFTDHEVYRDGIRQNPGHISEVCQYYAFFTGVATKEMHPKLWRILLNDFGPQREPGQYPTVAPANAFIGHYLRLELLCLDGQYGRLVKDMKGYFAPMARQCGTLWEHNSATASCCHGYASHVIYWLDKLYGKARR